MYKLTVFFLLQKSQVMKLLKKYHHVVRHNLYDLKKLNKILRNKPTKTKSFSLYVYK